MLKRIEVILNTFHYLFGFTDSESPFKPDGRGLFLLGVITPVLTALLRMTKWDDVLRNVSRAIGIFQRYPVIHSEYVPKPLRSSTCSALMIEVIQALLPILSSEPIGQPCLSKSSSIRSRVADLSSLWRLSISCICLPFALFHVWVQAFLSHVIALHFFYSWFIAVLPGVFRPMPLGSIFSIRECRTLAIILISTFNTLIPVFLSVPAKFKIENALKEHLATLNAAFDRQWGVNHSVSLSLTRMMMSASGASDRRSGISLADLLNYTMKLRGEHV